MEKILASAMLFVLLAAQPLPAQQSTPGAHVDVTATPAIGLPGQKVVISGSTGYHEKKHQAAVVVRHESGSPSATLSATVSPKGEFAVDFADTKKSGRYKVSVTAPDGKGGGTTEFRIDSVSELAAEVRQVVKELDGRCDKMRALAASALTSLPPSGERDAALQQLGKFACPAAGLELPIDEALEELEKVKQPPPPDSGLGALAAWIPVARSAIEEIDAFEDRSPVKEKSPPICETIHTALEGARFAAYAFNITNSLRKTIIKAVTDKGILLFAKSAMDPGADALAVSSALKRHVEKMQHDGNAWNSVYSIVLDLVEYGIEHVFEHYCSVFQGPVHAQMDMTWNEGIQTWLKYGVTLDGQLRLRYPKQAPAGQPVYMTGEIEGNATHFTFWENVTVVNKLPKSLLVVARQWLPPVKFLNSAKDLSEMGQIARAATPAYFDIPVIAEMTGETIKMQLKPARVDFTDAVKNRLLFVVFNGLIPEFEVFEFPIQKASWILTKGLEDPAILKIQKEGSGESAIKLTKPTHKETANRGVIVDWTISIDAKGEAEHGGSH